MEPLRCLVVAAIAALGVIAEPWAVALSPRPALAASAEAEAAAEAEMLKARQIMDRGEDAAAIEHLLAARALAPEASGPYLHLGLAYARLGRCEEAIPMLEEYLQRKRSSPHVSAAVTLSMCRKAGAANGPARKQDDAATASRALEIPAATAAPPAAAIDQAPVSAIAPAAPSAPTARWIAAPAQVQSPSISPSRATVPAEKHRPAWPAILGVTAGLIVTTCVVAGLAVGLTSASDQGPGGNNKEPAETLFPTGSTR